MKRVLVGSQSATTAREPRRAATPALVKFGAVRSGTDPWQRFEQLLDLCKTLSAIQGMSRLVAGVNTSRHDAYRRMIARGFRTEITGVAMHKPNEPGYNRPDVYAVDDWRHAIHTNFQLRTNLHLDLSI